MLRISIPMNSRLVVLIAVVLLMLSFASCKKKADYYSETALDSLVVIEELPMEKDYSVFHYGQKSDVIEDARKELADIDRQIEHLRSTHSERKDSLSEDAEAIFQRAMADLDVKRKSYDEQIKVLQDVRPEKWDSVKTEIANAYNIVKQSIENVRDEKDDLKENAEPEQLKGSKKVKKKKNTTAE